MKRLVKRARNLMDIVGFLRPVTDLPRYARYLNSSSRPLPPGAFRVRQCPGLEFTCRASTTDARVLQDTFAGLYHLPDQPLPRAATIVDLGANVGFVAAHYAVLYPDARLVCVELDAANAEACRRTLRPFDHRCTVVNAGVWTRDGCVRYGGDQEWSLHIQVQPDASMDGVPPEASGQRTARAITIDTLMREQALDHIDLLKMDIEGAELAVLRAGGAWAARTSQISVEFHRPITLAQITAALADLGFRTQVSARHPRQVTGVREVPAEGRGLDQRAAAGSWRAGPGVRGSGG